MSFGRLIPNDGAQEKVMRLDRSWFARNPDRYYRARLFDTRELTAGELDTLPYGHARWTLVFQIAPGFRLRAFLSLPREVAPNDSDESIQVFFEKCGSNAGYHDFPIKHFRPTRKTGTRIGAGYVQ